MPVKVKINCTVNSYPESNINWIHNYINLKETNQQALKKMRQALDLQQTKQQKKAARNNKLIKKNLQKDSTDSNNKQEDFNTEPSLYLTSAIVKYNIIESVLNQTHKQSTLVINIENESDFGAYECFANNNAGSRSAKFYVYGGKLN
jgi:hypothetical protein